VQKAGEESETAKREVDEGVGAANSFLHPDTYGGELVGVLVGLTVSCAKQLVPAAEGASTYQDAEEHQEAVGPTHDGGVERSRVCGAVRASLCARIGGG
jgi:hypothetical protein